MSFLTLTVRKCSLKAQQIRGHAGLLYQLKTVYTSSFKGSDSFWFPHAPTHTHPHRIYTNIYKLKKTKQNKTRLPNLNVGTAWWLCSLCGQCCFRHLLYSHLNRPFQDLVICSGPECTSVLWTCGNVHLWEGNVCCHSWRPVSVLVTLKFFRNEHFKGPTLNLLNQAVEGRPNKKSSKTKTNQPTKQNVLISNV